MPSAPRWGNYEPDCHWQERHRQGPYRQDQGDDGLGGPRPIWSFRPLDRRPLVFSVFGLLAEAARG